MYFGSPAVSCDVEYLCLSEDAWAYTFCSRDTWKKGKGWGWGSKVSLPNPPITSCWKWHKIMQKYQGRSGNRYQERKVPKFIRNSLALGGDELPKQQVVNNWWTIAQNKSTCLLSTRMLPQLPLRLPSFPGYWPRDLPREMCLNHELLQWLGSALTKCFADYNYISPSTTIVENNHRLQLWTNLFWCLLAIKSLMNVCHIKQRKAEMDREQVHINEE